MHNCFQAIHGDRQLRWKACGSTMQEYDLFFESVWFWKEPWGTQRFRQYALSVVRILIDLGALAVVTLKWLCTFLVNYSHTVPLPSWDLIKLFIRANAIQTGSTFSSPWIVSDDLFTKFNLVNKYDDLSLSPYKVSGLFHSPFCVIFPQNVF